MTTDLCPDAAVVHITAPQIITSEAAGGSGATAGAGGATAGTRAGGSAVELGRRLLLAARAGDTPLVLDLMAKGAPFTTDWLGTSPLHLAASNAHVETCGVLLRAGVSRDSRTKVDRTPLHLAAYAGHADVAELLLEHGALVDCRDMLRMTPLHWAAQGGHAGVARALLRHGADARARSKFHKTPQQLAAERGHAAVCALIDDALRDATRLVRPRLADRPEDTSPETPQRPVITPVQRIQEIKIKPKSAQEKPPKAEIKIKAQAQAQAGEERGEGGEGAAAQLLRRHGITLLPADDGSTLLNALQSGRTVVLSDAGKLMLKESGPAVRAAASAGAAGASAASAGGAGSAAGAVAAVAAGGAARGVVLTATPVRAPPPGVKVFTLNNRLRPDQPRKLLLPDNQQIKIVQLPPDARVVSPRRLQRARRVVPAPAASPASIAPAAAAAPSPGPTATRTPVKIIMNKSNFQRLVASARLDPAAAATLAPVSDASAPAVSPAVVVASEAAEGGSAGAAGADGAADPATLAAALAEAQRTVAALADELRRARARLARYEPA